MKRHEIMSIIKKSTDFNEISAFLVMQTTFVDNTTDKWYHSCVIDFPIQCKTCSFNSVLGVLPCSEQYFLNASASSFRTLHPRVAMCSRLYLLDAFFCASLTAIIPPPLVIVLYMENVELTIYIMHKLYG